MDVTGHITGREIILIALYAIAALTLVGLLARRSKH